jgi:hypothetical protein
MTNVILTNANPHLHPLIPIIPTKGGIKMQEQSILLNDLYADYVKGMITKKDLESAIFQLILKNSEYFHLRYWDKEKCIDYLCWLYPRLSKNIATYKEKGASFGSYISALIHWSSKEFQYKELNSRIFEYTCWKAMSEDMEAHSPEPEYTETVKAEAYASYADNPRQLLILLLKSYFFISEDYLHRAASVMGIDEKELKVFIDAIQRQRIKRDERIRTLKERIHCQHYRCIAYEKKLSFLNKESLFYEKMKNRLERSKFRLEGMRKRLAGIRLTPSNSQVAEVLGVPKGTIDSTLFAIRRKYHKELAEIGNRSSDY